MARCLAALSHYLNQCWLIITQVPWLSYDDNAICTACDINTSDEEARAISPMAQWVKGHVYHVFSPLAHKTSFLCIVSVDVGMISVSERRQHRANLQWQLEDIYIYHYLWISFSRWILLENSQNWHRPKSVDKESITNIHIWFCLFVEKNQHHSLHHWRDSANTLSQIWYSLLQNFKINWIELTWFNKAQTCQIVFYVMTLYMLAISKQIQGPVYPK